jgi:RNA polymerase sigma-70 factor (ECF subfamily)
MTTTGITDAHGDAAPDDAALLAAHVAGDPDAFGELVRRHRDRLWAVALRTTSDPEEASDALQDAFISAYRNAASFRGESAVTTWLHRVVVNACLDRMRRRKVRPTVPLPEEDGETGHRGIADPRDDLDRLELRMEIDRALAALPLDQRAAIILVDVEGLSVADAALALGIPEGTVKSRCSRGRARLAVALAGLRNPDAGSGVPSRQDVPSPAPTDHPTAPDRSDPEVS